MRTTFANQPKTRWAQRSLPAANFSGVDLEGSLGGTRTRSVDVLGSAVVGPDGTFVGSFQVPEDFAPGAYVVTANGLTDTGARAHQGVGEDRSQCRTSLRSAWSWLGSIRRVSVAPAGRT